MNEDEIIKNLNDLLEHNYLEDVGYLREENDYIIYNNAIQGLLDLYKKEKEKNEELSIIKEEIKVLQINGLMDEQYIVIANWNLKNTSYKHLLDDYISKDKIKEIIKQLENDIKKTRDKKYRAPGEYISDYDKVRLKAYITKTEEIKKRLQELVEEN